MAEEQVGNQDENQDGNQEQDYRLNLSEEIRPALDKFPSIENLATGYIELEKDTSRLRNAKGVIIPDEGATDAEMDTYYNSLGRPETPDGYGLEKPELPEGMVYDEARTKVFAEAAHKLGVTAPQLKGLHALWNEQAKTEYESQTKTADEFLQTATAEMKKEWGADFEANLAAGDAMIEQVFGADFKKFLADTGLASHPDVVKGMFKASQAIGEHGLSTGRTAGSGGDFTWEKLVSMKADPRYSDPGKKDIAYVKEVEAYNQGYAATLGANS